MRKNKIIAIMLTVCMLFAVCTEISFAGSKKSMVAYTDAIKSGSTVYCMLPGVILSVNTKTKEITRLSKRMGLLPNAMKLHKGYLYYTQADQESSGLYRINLKSKKNECLTVENCYSFEFAISGSKIYYEAGGKKVMKLDGKSKKKSGYSVKTKRKASNVTGYKIKTKGEFGMGEDFYYGEGSFHSWLIMPGNAKIDLGVWYGEDIFL